MFYVGGDMASRVFCFFMWAMLVVVCRLLSFWWGTLSRSVGVVTAVFFTVQIIIVLLIVKATQFLSDVGDLPTYMGDWD